MMTRRYVIAATGGLVAATAGAVAQTVSPGRSDATMEIKRSGSQPSRKGPAEYFTGSVRIDPLFQAGDPARVSGGSVTFEPAARTAWHTHPLGQTLLITSGLGWVQRENGPIEEVRPGDVVWFPPGLKHWHGATPMTAMTHIATRNRGMERTWIGWKRSATNNIASEPDAISIARFLRNSVASAIPSACREPPCDCLCWKF
jgi:quercetin dioxygenase-like cupin family protein